MQTAAELTELNSAPSTEGDSPEVSVAWAWTDDLPTTAPPAREFRRAHLDDVARDVIAICQNYGRLDWTRLRELCNCDYRRLYDATNVLRATPLLVESHEDGTEGAHMGARKSATQFGDGAPVANVPMKELPDRIDTAGFETLLAMRRAAILTLWNNLEPASRINENEVKEVLDNEDDAKPGIESLLTNSEARQGSVTRLNKLRSVAPDSMPKEHLAALAHVMLDCLGGSPRLWREETDKSVNAAFKASLLKMGISPAA